MYNYCLKKLTTTILVNPNLTLTLTLTLILNLIKP